MNLPINQIMNGDALQHLKELPDESISCVMTSPPYWALRDYGFEGQLGLEKTFEEYINKLCDIFDEVKRVLRKDGTCWVNLGDTYSATRWTGEGKGQPMNKMKDGHRDINPERITGLPDKCLVMIPFRFAIEMVKRGWILRNTIIWHKPNCMPSSTKDRFTVDFEYLFFFTKSKKYWFETQYEPYTPLSDVRYRQALRAGRSYAVKSPYKNNIPYSGKSQKISKEESENYDSPRARYKRGTGSDTSRADDADGLVVGGNNPLGKNKRTVWSICPKPFPEAHFAVYPEELCWTPIKAGCPEFVCKKCGKAREVIFEPSESYKKFLGKSIHNHKFDMQKGMSQPHKSVNAEYIKKGYSECRCNAGFSPGIVLDPFFGSGTTGLVALKQNKQFIGIEMNPEYIEIAKKRLKPFVEQQKL